jgi:nucleotide-binding universal stress UspA family protein
MYTKILVPTDGSQLSDRALREAGQLARITGATLTLFYAAPAYRMPVSTFDGMLAQNVVTPERYRRSMRAHAKRLLDAAARKASGTVTRRVCEFSDQPYEAIIAAAKKNHCDLIVMASHGWRGLKGLLLGSETHKVLTHSRVPVLVVR